MIFIAELGLNHDGNFDLIYEMIKESKLAGADIAKFQFGWRDKPGEINCIDEKQALQIKKWCDYFEIEMMVSPITPSGYNIAKEANADTTNPLYNAPITFLLLPNLTKKVPIIDVKIHAPPIVKG